MELQHIVTALVLLWLGLLDNAVGAAVRVDGHPALPRRPCSYTTDGAGIASVICHFPTGAPHGGHSGHCGAHPSGYSISPLSVQINASWAPVTETYTTTSLDVVYPLNHTQTLTDLSTELTSTTLELKTATQTIVEIAGYSTIGTHTTTFQAPASSSTYSAIKTVTTTTSELLVPSIDTVTLTGFLPPSAQYFPTMDAQKRAAVWGLTENGTGVLVNGHHQKRSAWGNSTAQSTGVPPYLTAAAIKAVPILSDGEEPSNPAKLSHEQTQSSSTNVLVITVTNTYSVTPTLKPSHKTISSLEDTTSWLTRSPAASNSTRHLATASTMHNSSAVIQITTMVPETISTKLHTTSVESVANMPTDSPSTSTVTLTSTSGCNAIFNGPILRVVLAVMAMRLFVVV